MSDSDPNVNPDVGRFTDCHPTRCYPAGMPTNRDDVVSNFVRHKIREWQESKRELQQLARIAQFAKSTPSQVLLGTGVGAKTGPKFARAFGFSSYDAMRDAAWLWWQAQGRAGKEAVTSPRTEPMREAIEVVLSLKQGTAEQLEVILAAYTHERFIARDQAWWVQTLLAELEKDRAAAAEDRLQREDIAQTQRSVRIAQSSKRNKAKSEPSKPKRIAS